MTAFENVTVIKKANIYFDGRVTSRTVRFADGQEKTLGFMLPGEYEFSTGKAETMEILAGELEVRLPGSASAQKVQGGESFEVPAQSKFSVTIQKPTDYCCSFHA